MLKNITSSLNLCLDNQGGAGLSDITVVISNFNYGRFVSSAIDSCLSQTISCEIIVVDDASVDDSWDIIEKYKDQGVKAVRLKKNSGGNARGKNVGICLCSTKYITCLDSDDMLLPNSLELRMPFPDDIDFVHGWSYSVKSSSNYRTILTKTKLPRFSFNKKARKLAGQSEPRWAFAVQASTVLAPKRMYETFGLYDEEMRWTIDREMWYRWLVHGSRKKVIPQYVSLYRKHPGQLTRDRTRKDPKKSSALLAHRIKLRRTITPENTILMGRYDHQSFIDEVR